MPLSSEAKAPGPSNNQSLARGRIAEMAREFLCGRSRGALCRDSVIVAVFLVGVGIAIAHIVFNLFGFYETFFIRPMHLLLLGAFGFVIYDHRGRRRSFEELSPWLILDGVLIIALTFAAGRIIAGQDAFMDRYVSGMATQMDYIAGGVLVLLVLELARRVTGYMLVLLALMFIAYQLFGDNLPGVFRHRGSSWEAFIEFQYMDYNGVWNLMGVIATTVIMFIVYGSFFEKAGGGALIQNLGNYLFGTSTGGPAKVSVVTSSLFGSLSGSAVANVVGTGSFTIPAMKRSGFPGHMAGAVEAVASTGGQIMPPVMGAVAFVMATFLGVPYLEVVKAALLPAILFYVALFVVMHYEARRRGIGGISRDQVPSIGDVMAFAHLALPLFILVGMLVVGYSPVRSAMIATAATLVVAMLRKNTRIGLWGILSGAFAAVETTIVVTVACAAAGIVIGVLDQTGLGLRLSSIIINMTAGMLMPTLMVVMVTCLILGMGMPTVPAYVITVAIAGPILIDMGVNPMAAHMFVLYYAVLSLLTPPVMIASFAAAALAETPVMRLALTAIKFASIAFIIPFFFVYSPELLLGSVPTDMLRLSWVTLTAVLGATTFAAALAGYYFGKIGWILRIALVAVGFMLIYPENNTDVVGVALLVMVTLTRRESRLALSNLLAQITAMRKSARDKAPTRRYSDS
jgi:TRAP transporter 4TM/12TM fusion protein